MQTSRISQIARSVLAGRAIDRTEAVELLRLEGQDIYELLYWANRIRSEVFGSSVQWCGILSILTGGCSEDCRYCAQSSHNAVRLPVTQASSEQIEAAGKEAQDHQLHCFSLVASGRELSPENLARWSKSLKCLADKKALVCAASLGSLTLPQAKQLRQLGLRRYHHNLETSRRYFPQIATTHSYDERLATLKTAREAGLELCCGGIIGLGESREDRVDLALELRDQGIEHIPLNFHHPVAGTPLEGNPVLSPLEALQAVAMFRFVLPQAHIKIAGGRDICLRDMQSWLFYAGADGIMVGDYLTTRGRSITQDKQLVDDLKLHPDTGATEGGK